MKDTLSGKAGQAGVVENARTKEHYYARVPDCLWRLPAYDRVSAIEVWVGCHHYLRAGSDPIRITDEQLMQCPSLNGRSSEHIGKGLAVLARLGLIRKIARGSRREVAIVARLKGPRKDNLTKPPSIGGLLDKRHEDSHCIRNSECDVPAAGRAMAFWVSVRENQQAGI